MVWTRLPDAETSAMATGIAGDGEHLALFIQVDTAVVAMDLDTAIELVSSLMTILPIVASGKMPEGLVATDSPLNSKRTRKAVKANRKVLDLE